MKIKVKQTFVHESGCFVKGREYDLPEDLGQEVVAAKLAEEVKPKPEKPVK